MPLAAASMVSGSSSRSSRSPISCLGSRGRRCGWWRSVSCTPNRRRTGIWSVGSVPSWRRSSWSSPDRGARTRLIARTFRVRGCAFWIAGAIVGPIALGLAALSAIQLAGGDVAWRALGRSAELSRLPSPVYWLASLTCYGFGEEVGWRGFLLPRLQDKRSVLTAPLIVGVIWAGWHLPFFAFSPGMTATGPGAVLGWGLSILSGSFLMAWLFNASRGSVLTVACFPWSARRRDHVARTPGPAHGDGPGADGGGFRATAARRTRAPRLLLARDRAEPGGLIAASRAGSPSAPPAPPSPDRIGAERG